MSTTESFAAPAPQQVPIEPRSNPAPTPAETSTPKAEQPEAKPSKPDLDTALKTAFERSQAKAEGKPDPKAEATPKPDDKPVEKSEASPAEKPEAKAAPERAPDGKFVSKEPKEPKEPSAAPSSAEPAEGSGQGGKDQPRPSEGRDYSKPPAHFLPRAKEAWATVNPDVQGEVHRMAENFEKGIAEYKESHEKWKALREFEAEAKAAGTTIPDYIRSVRAIETMLQTNPEEGIKRVLATAGITPEQYARHILAREQKYAQNPALAQTEQLNSTIQNLQRQIQQMEMRDRERERANQEALLARQVEQQFIEPFKAEPGHERYDELQEDIAFFLNSGKIPSTLSERDRLEAAYDMAERINPAPLSHAPAPGTQASAPRPLDPAGTKSVTGSPTPGLSTGRPASKEEAKDLDGALRRAFARATAR